MANSDAMNHKKQYTAYSNRCRLVRLLTIPKTAETSNANNTLNSKCVIEICGMRPRRPIRGEQ